MYSHVNKSFNMSLYSTARTIIDNGRDPAVRGSVQLPYYIYFINADALDLRSRYVGLGKAAKYVGG